MFNFTPMEDGKGLKIPYFEDATADFAPYYTSARQGRSVESAKLEVSNEMAKLGAAISRIVAGKFDNMDPPRYGFQVYYFFGGQSGRLDVACLPMRSESVKKIEAAQVQALMNVRDWLKAAVTARVFAPGSNFLVGHLLVDGTHTVNEYIASQGKLPQLNPPSGIIQEE